MPSSPGLQIQSGRAFDERFRDLPLAIRNQETEIRDRKIPT
jgi:hypothetical protein